jgi:choline-glycine betaine transporter
MGGFMSEDATSGQEMSAFQKIIGIFTTPRLTFEAIDQKPTWFLPFIIGVIFFLIMQILTIDIQTTDQIAMMEARDMPQEQLDAAKSQMAGPLKYVSLVAGPIVWLIMIVIMAAIFYVAGNLMIGGDSSFKKVFAIVCWSGLVGVIGIVLMTLLMLANRSLDHRVGGHL